MNQKRMALILSATAVLGACQKAPTPGPTFEELRADPQRTREIMLTCRDHPGQFSEETCRAAYQAKREQFMGSGKAKYTPGGAPPKSTDEER